MAANTGIVVGVDGSEGSARALRWAVGEGQVRGWPVTAALAWTYLDQHHPEVGAPFDAAYDEAAARSALDTYVDAAGVGPDVERAVVNDLAAPALLSAATGAELLVVGARGLGGFKGLLLGSVSRHVLDHAPCPVAVIHTHGEAEPPVPAAGGRVVVGTDGSEEAAVALRWAAGEARARGAVLQVVHAWHLPPVGGYLDGAPQFDAEAIRDYAARTLEESVAGLDTTGITVEPALVQESAAGAVLEASKGADLAVVGHRGLGRVAGFLLGSTSLRVVHHTEVPVVVVPNR